MKKKLQFVFSLLVFSSASFAQQNNNEEAPFVAGGHSLTVDRALWTVQLDIDPKNTALGIAGAFWTGTEFWVSKWGNDSLFTINASGVATGSFTIPGITGTRSITSDGTSFYIGANTTSIYKVNPITKTLIGTIATSVPLCRYVTYDPTLNAGAGGLWTGTYSSDIVAVSFAGATLSTIPATTHGLTGIYGIAYDPYSSGGPYLWAYDQTTPGATLFQLEIATGALTTLSHDTQLDLAAGVGGGLAGGLFITNSFVTGKKTIGGINQGLSLFAYELADPSGVESINKNDFDLSVYPNPSSYSSEIKFKLNSENVVSVEVYNLLGSLVSKVDAEKMSSGVHTISIDDSNLNNGSYMVKLIVGNTFASSKLSIMK